MTNNLNQFRQSLQKQRLVLSEQTQSDAAEKVWQHFTSSIYYQDSEHIAVYMANNNELNTQAIIQSIWRDHKKCYLPVLHPQNQGHMHFVLYEQNDVLQKNRFGIPEPHLSHHKLIAEADLDIVLLPLLAFDEQGHRVGMGAGYYDRSFQFMLREPHPHKPLLFGLAYEFQNQGSLEPQPWDVPLNGVITEVSFRQF